MAGRRLWTSHTGQEGFPFEDRVVYATLIAGKSAAVRLCVGSRECAPPRKTGHLAYRPSAVCRHTPVDIRKGKPVVRRGRKAYEPLEEVVGLPKGRAAWYVTFMAVCCTCLLLSGGGSAAADGVDFRDDFTGLDPARWSKGDHELGRSYLDPANVDVDGENLRIKLPARALNGGEISTRDLYGYGSYAARMKLPNAPSAITGFFLYKAPDLESEIDIEVFNDSTRRVMFTTYAGGRQTHTETMRLPFDPTTGFHEYRFDYSQESVTFFVDGKEMRSWNTGIPQTSMHLMVNSWFPNWLEGKRPKKTTHTYVDSMGYVSQPPAG